MNRSGDGYDSDSSSISHSDAERSASPVSPLDRLRQQLENLQHSGEHRASSSSPTAQAQYASYVAVAQQAREQTTGFEATRLYSNSNDSRWTLMSDARQSGASSPVSSMPSGDSTARNSFDETGRPPIFRRHGAMEPRRGR